MKILFVNDDGYDANGLHAVADLFKKEHVVTVVAPDRQRSAYSHAITTHSRELTYKKVAGYDYDVYSVDGTPADCAKIGLSLFRCAPDVIISGINSGRNIGTDVMYSGTVGAAFEAAYYDIKGFALSHASFCPTQGEFDAFAKFIKNNFEKLLAINTAPKTILNINYPVCAPKGVKVVKMSTARAFSDTYEQGEDGLEYKPLRGEVPQPDTDEFLSAAGYITITPLTIDQTDYAVLKKLKKEKFIL